MSHSLGRKLLLLLAFIVPAEAAAPPPVLNSISITSATAGTNPFQITVNGDSFTQSDQLQFTLGANSPIQVPPTSVPTGGQFPATVPASVLNVPGTYAVTVLDVSTALVSGAVSFTVLPPAISSISPSQGTAKGPGFVLTVNGANFVCNPSFVSVGCTSISTVLFGGTPLATTFVNTGQLTAIVPGPLPSTPGTINVTVQNPSVQSQSAPALFTVLGPVQITTAFLPGGTPGLPYDAFLSATGGRTPYSWTVRGLPAGLSLNATTGEITGSPASGGSSTIFVTVVDANNASASTQLVLGLVTPAPLALTTPSPLTSATQGVSYGNVLGATGGTGQYSFSITGGALPGGLTLRANGTITGIPTAAGQYTFTVQVNDAVGDSVQGNYVLTVLAPPLTITTGPVGSAAVGSAFNVTFAATGGVPPYQFAISGNTPPGTQASGATLAGTLTTPGTYSFTVTVTDKAATTASMGFTLTVTGTALTITTTPPLPGGQAGTAYGPVQFGASGGTGSYGWTATGLPPGTNLSGGGLLNGTPTTAGSYSITVTVTDAAGEKASATFAVTIGMTIRGSLANGTVGTAYSGSLTAVGGVGTLTWSAAGLPPGITFSSGAFAGTPTTAGTYTVAVNVSDAQQNKASGSYTVIVAVAPPPPLQISSPTIPAATVGSAFSVSFSATGGTPPYTFSASGLPSGLTISTGGAISGTPSASGSSSVTVTVTDKAGATASRSFTLNPLLPSTPPLAFSGISGSTAPASQFNVGVGLGSPYPVDITVKLVMTFAPVTGSDDPSVQFAGGGRTVTIVIPAGQTVGSTTPGIQSGTVAGTITITAQLLAGTQDLTPSPAPVKTIVISPTVPVISSITAVRSTSGFTVTMVGYSSTRQVTQAIFSFNASTGTSLQTSSVTIDVSQIFSAWYSSSASAPFGSQFSFAQPFNVSGSPQSIVSVSVTLVNSVGSSLAAAATLQ